MSALESLELEFASNVLKSEALRRANPVQAAADIFQMEEAFRMDLAQQRIDYRTSPFLKEAIQLAYSNSPDATNLLFVKVYEWFAAHRVPGPKSPQELNALHQALVFPPMSQQAAQKFNQALNGGADYGALWAVATGPQNPYFMWGNPVTIGEKTQYVFVRSDRYIRNYEGELAPDFTSAVVMVHNNRTQEVTVCPTVATDTVVMTINGNQLNGMSIAAGKSSDFVTGGRLALKPVEPMQMHTAMIHANPDKRVLSAHDAAGGSCKACNIQVKCISQVGMTHPQRMLQQ